MSTCRSAEDELKDANKEFVERNYKSALELYNLSIELDDNSSEAFVRRGACHQKLHHYGDALSDANRAISLDPMSLKAYRLKAEASYESGDYQTAKESYEKCQNLDHNDTLLVAWVDRLKELTGDAPSSTGTKPKPPVSRGPKPKAPGKEHQSPFSFAFPKAPASSNKTESKSSSSSSSSSTTTTTTSTSSNNNNNSNNATLSSSSSSSAPKPKDIDAPVISTSDSDEDSDDERSRSGPSPISERAPRAPQRPIEPPKPPAPKAPKAPRAPKYGSVPPPPKPPLEPEPEEPEVPRPPPHPYASRFTWVQTDNYVVVTVFMKAEKNDVSVDFEPNSLGVNVKLSSDNQFVLDLELAGDIDPAGSKFEVLPTKIECKMRKAQPVKWAALEKKDDIHLPTKKKKNWDRILAHEEEERDPSFNQTMRDMYDCASEEERRAMMKSFHESGGTVLSADWKDVGKGFVEPKPPPGVTRWEKPEKS